MTLTLWKDRETKTMDPELFSVKAEAFARQINQESTHSTNKGTQLRKFFDEILRLNTLAKGRDANWNLILPQVHMIIAKVAYAKGRKLVTDSFVDHVRQGINQIETPEDLQIFCSHMEAFTGFYKMYNQN